MTWIFKRTYKDNMYPIFVHVSRQMADSYEKRIETHKIITERLYFDFLAQADSNYATTKKSIISFLMKIKEEFNIFHIERIEVKNEVYNVLKIIRDSDHDDLEIIPKFLNIVEDITENKKFFSTNLSRL